MFFEKVNVDNPRLLYLQVADTIEKNITNNEINVGQRIPPIRELHKKFGVGLDTVKEALSKLEKEGYISCIRKRGTFVISSEPKNGIDLTRKNEVAIVVPSHTKDPSSEDSYLDSRLNRIIRGIEEKVREKGLYLIYSTISEVQLSLKGKGKEIAGMIVTGGINYQQFKIIKKSNISFILIDDLPKKTKATDENVDVIVNDEFQGSYLATKHLTDLGHRRIAYVCRSFEESFWNVEMLRGYEKALKEASINYADNLKINTAGIGFDSGYLALNKLLSKSLSFTGLVCFGRIRCQGAVQAVREKGMKIPEDISVVCLGDSSEVTSVVYDSKEIGRVALERLVKRVTNPGLTPERIVVPYKLTVRNSTKQLLNK